MSPDVGAGHQLVAALEAAFSRLQTTVEDLDGVYLLTTAGAELVQLALRVGPTTDDDTVLDFCCPVLRDPAPVAILRTVANNGMPWSLFGAGMFSPYIGSDGNQYLGVFVRMPLASGFWYEQSMTALVGAACHSVAALRDHFGEFVNWCTATRQPLGGEVYPDCRSGCPPKL